MKDWAPSCWMWTSHKPKSQNCPSSGSPNCDWESIHSISSFEHSFPRPSSWFLISSFQCVLNLSLWLHCHPLLCLLPGFCHCLMLSSFTLSNVPTRIFQLILCRAFGWHHWLTSNLPPWSFYRVKLHLSPWPVIPLITGFWLTTMKNALTSQFY